MTFKLTLSDHQPKEEIVVPTTDLFQEYVKALSMKPKDNVYSLCTLSNGNIHRIIEHASPQAITDELCIQYLSSEGGDLPHYLLELHLKGLGDVGYIRPLIERDEYNKLRALNTAR